MLERLIAFIATHDGVRFDTLGGYAQRWAQANPLETWKLSGSVHARSG